MATYAINNLLVTKTIYADTFELEQLRRENESLRAEVERLAELAEYLVPLLMNALEQPISDGSDGYIQ